MQLGDPLGWKSYGKKASGDDGMTAIAYLCIYPSMLSDQEPWVDKITYSVWPFEHTVVMLEMPALVVRCAADT